MTWALALSGIGAGFSLLQGVAGMRAGQQNAANAEAEGRHAVATGEAEAARQRRINLYNEGRFIAEEGASGTQFTGSPLLRYLEDVKQGELMAQDKIYAGRLTGQQKKAEAKIYRHQAGGALFGGIAQAGATLGSTLLSQQRQAPPKPKPKG